MRKKVKSVCFIKPLVGKLGGSFHPNARNPKFLNKKKAHRLQPIGVHKQIFIHSLKLETQSYE